MQLIPAGVELIGENLGHGRLNALAHFGAGIDERNGVVTRNANVSVNCNGSRALIGSLIRATECHAQHQTACDTTRDLRKGTAITFKQLRFSIIHDRLRSFVNGPRC